jgi:hypothetical protein
VVELSRTEARRMIDTGEICDVKTVLLIDRLDAQLTDQIPEQITDTCRSRA